MNRTVLLVGVGIAAIILGVLFVGLGKNPNEIRSPLIDRPAPTFALREVGTGRTVDLAQFKGTPRGDDPLPGAFNSVLNLEFFRLTFEVDAEQFRPE